MPGLIISGERQLSLAAMHERALRAAAGLAALGVGPGDAFAVLMRNADDEQLARLVTHPAALIGASDAGAHVLSNTDSCYAVWTLQHWVRERRVLTLERAVAMLTWEQAQLLGLTDRGLLRVGMAGDLVVFDPDLVGTTGVRFVDDQPAGGRRLITDATGLLLSVVNGVVATREGVSTGARPGRR